MRFTISNTTLWIKKYRKRLLTEEIGEYVKQVFERIADSVAYDNPLELVQRREAIGFPYRLRCNDTWK